MILSPFAAVVCLVGLIVYLVCGPAKPAELGRLMFWTGLLAFLLAQGAHLTRIG